MSNDEKWRPTAERINVKLVEGMKKLNKIWIEIGLLEDVIMQRNNQVYSHYEDLMREMLNEAEQSKQTLLEELQKLMTEAHTLSMELKTKHDMTDYEDLPLLEIRTAIMNHLQDLRSVKQQRLNAVKEFLDKEYEICKSLGIKPLGIDVELPTENEMKRFHTYLEKISAEKARADVVFQESRNSVIAYMNELGISPSTEFEQVVCNDTDNFILNKTNINSLKELVHNLEMQIDEAKQEVEAKKKELETLWKYLDEPLCKFQEFITTHMKYDVHTIRAYNEEIKRCKDKRNENISKYVNNIRSQIKMLWDQCQISERERREFHFMQSQTFTEDLLVLHEMEMERLQKYYSDNRQLFELLKQRDDLWQKWADLEERASDPNRFQNRGGQLLIEEKERKILQKKFPIITEEIEKLLGEYELKNGKPFTINGVAVADELKRTCTEYNAAKQSAMLARKQARDQLDKSKKNTPLSVSKRTPMTLSMRCGTSVVKRKDRDGTPLGPPSKKRNVSSDSNRPKYTASKLKRRSRKVSRRIFQTSRGDQNVATDAKQKEQTPSTSDTISSYGEFQQHLEQRDELRSSVLPQTILSSIDNKSHTPSRVKTPIKPARRNLSAIVPRKATPNKLTLTPRSTPRSPRIKTTSRLVPAPAGSKILGNTSNDDGKTSLFSSNSIRFIAQMKR